MQMIDEHVPSYGLLIINNAYTEGTINFQGWLELPRLWALKVIEQYEREECERRERRTR